MPDKSYPQLNAAHSIADSLRQAMTLQASVTLHLRSGSQLAGQVADVGDHAVVLQALSQREFYDALVRIEDITALETRARDR